MPVTESQFSLGQLWPKSNHNWMAPGARNGMDETFGKGLDVGALRVRNGIWEIVIPKSPTHIDPTNAEWVPFEPTTFDEKDLHFIYASAFNRYGQGWSYGPGHNLHDEVVGYFQELYGRTPSAMEKLDIEHDKGLWQKLLADHAARFPVEPVPDRPSPTAPPVLPAEPPIVPPPVVPAQPVIAPTPPVQPPLSPASQRAEELWSIAKPLVRLTLLVLRPAMEAPERKVDQLWIVGKPLAVALIEAWRRRGRVVPLIVLALGLSLMGCTTWTAVRLCGVGALNPARECVVGVWGDTRSGQITKTGAQLVPRGLFPSAPKPRSAREIERDTVCGREALRKQQEHYARHGVPTPYAPLEMRCKRRETLRHWRRP